MEPLAHRQLAELERDHWWFRGRRAVCMGLLSAGLDGERPPRVLDLGTGSGGFLADLAGLSREVRFTDLDAGVVATCGERGFRGGIVSTADALPFRDGSFDLVCLFDVIEHVEAEGAALREVGRVLRPGGRVFLHAPAYPWLFAENDRVAGHHRRYTRQALRAAVEGAGLEVERVTHTNLLLFPLIAPTVLALKALQRMGFGRGRTNLSIRLPRWVQALLYRAFAAELCLSRRVDLPIGHSIAAFARRAA